MLMGLDNSRPIFIILLSEAVKSILSSFIYWQYKYLPKSMEGIYIGLY